MKNDRQNQLLQIISEEIIETQEQLLERLQAKGIKSTQATISRDIKELHLIKEPAGQGRYRYAVSAHRTKLNFADKLRTIFRESVLTVDNARISWSSRPCRAWPTPPVPPWTAWTCRIWWGPWPAMTRPC